MKTKSRFVEMFGDFQKEIPLSYYIESLTAGKSLAGDTQCKNKVLKTGAVTYDQFDSSQVKDLPKSYTPLKSHLVHKGDVLISRMNTAELVGAAAYVWDIQPFTYLPDRLWRANLQTTASPIFLWKLLTNIDTKESIRRFAGGTSGSMKNISKTALLSIMVPKIPLKLQNRFSDFICQLDKSGFVTPPRRRFRANRRKNFVARSHYKDFLLESSPVEP